MAKRSDKLKENLNGKPGWRNQIAQARVQQPSRSESKANYARKTWLIEPEMIERVKRLAEESKVGQNEFVRYLLSQALDQFEAGDIELPLVAEYHIKQ